MEIPYIYRDIYIYIWPPDANRIYILGGAWWATAQKVTKSWTRLSMHACIYIYIYTHICVYIYKTYIWTMCVCVSVPVCVYVLSHLSRVQLCDPTDCSTPGLPVPHHLPEFAEVHAHCISDAVQPSHSLTPSTPSALTLSQHQGLFQ